MTAPVAVAIEEKESDNGQDQIRKTAEDQL
jgi:hypothetical protein